MESLPEQLVAEFLSDYRASGVYPRDRIARLTELATAHDTQTAESATRALFTALVERLADSFEPEAVSLYNRAFAQVIQACRLDPRSAQLDQELEKLGLPGEQDLIARADRLRDVYPRTALSDPAGEVQRVIVLSRVTLGADVAITSLIIERMKLSFPAAEIVLVGGTKAPELFGGDPRVRFKEIAYRRAGTTIERLLTWIDLLGCVREVTDGLKRAEYLIVDPDTRLTQLGLLPVERPDLTLRGSHACEPDLAAQAREYQAFLLGWSGRTDPDGNAYVFHICRGPQNESAMCNAEVDRLLNEARTVSALAARKAVYEKLTKIILEEDPIIYLYHRHVLIGHTARLEGYKQLPDGLVRVVGLRLK